MSRNPPPPTTAGMGLTGFPPPWTAGKVGVTQSNRKHPFRSLPPPFERTTGSEWSEEPAATIPESTADRGLAKTSKRGGDI